MLPNWVKYLGLVLVIVSFALITGLIGQTSSVTNPSNNQTVFIWGITSTHFIENTWVTLFATIAFLLAFTVFLPKIYAYLGLSLGIVSGIILFFIVGGNYAGVLYYVSLDIILIIGLVLELVSVYVS